ncbi:pyruvate, water dikinase regulatory protein [Salinisphaera sp. Q1T1-3]|uniref:posphoenolpyruvate synthetase regulatory kinase/phosphorylase PpsR n=1 Tax=Salinisphaera sp. Q1T1-3 TaxID=2321229 RepID=UPI000E7362F0|nr:pyruvate, water dikinase regulatory protein [Salinisphaera sp. Q1T1-3]RJS92408.1 kinase/pyrophosphorylase [Salinisphaera sp. Q1T1-3]
MNDTNQPSRAVFFVSDRTGITAETLGATLLTQFDERQFRQSTLPFINSADKARTALEYIEHTGRNLGTRPIVFSTTVSDDVREILRGGAVVFLDLFDAFVPQLEAALEAKSSHQSGRAHGIADQAVYESRIEAMNFALAHDDGVGENGYERAEIILMAPSRCGKTPVCVYMAMQHGIFAANYPLTEDQFESNRLPAALAPYKHKLYGLYIAADRLHQIRSERRRGSHYAAIGQVSYELRQAAALYKRHGIPYVETTNRSIEEVAAVIMQDRDLRRRSF